MACQATYGIDHVIVESLKYVTTRGIAAYDILENSEKAKELVKLLNTLLCEAHSIITVQEDVNHKVSGSVEAWLQSVRNEISTFKVLVSKFFCYSHRPSLLRRWKYGPDFKESIERIRILLLNYLSYGNRLVVKVAQPAVLHRPNRLSVGTDATLNTIMAHLEDDRLGVIGLYGEAGIGMTNILDELNERLKGKPLGFEKILLVDVAEPFDKSKVINQIGCQVLKEHPNEFSWRNEIIEIQIRLIFGALSGKKFLLLFDGIREEIDFRKIGVPNPTPENGSKVLFSCPSEHVCGLLESQKNIEIKALSPEDAWDLLKRTVTRCADNHSLDDPEIRPLAIQVCNQCDGVPKKLVTIGRKMANAKTAAEWENCLETQFGSLPAGQEVEVQADAN